MTPAEHREGGARARQIACDLMGGDSETRAAAEREIKELADDKRVLVKAASELLKLKDGPRDEEYERRKLQAWDELRAALDSVQEGERS